MKDLELIKYLIDGADDFGQCTITISTIKVYPIDVIEASWIARILEQTQRDFKIDYSNSQTVLSFPLTDLAI